MAWYIILGALLAIFFLLAVKRRPQFAIGVVLPLAFLFPVWVMLPVLAPREGTIVGSGVDLRVGVSAAALILYCCFWKKATYPISLVPCDFAMIGLVVVHVASDIFNQGPSWEIPGHIFGEWWLPYVSGRLAFQFRRDISEYWKVLAAVSIGLALLAISEAFANASLPEMLFGARPTEGVERIHMRWGIRRAYGPCLNPIYNGVLQLILLGWTVDVFLRVLRNRASVAWVAAPALSIFGIICTGSRGPLVGLVIAVIGMVFGLRPKLRLPIIACAGLSLLLMIANRNYVMQTLESWAGENRASKSSTIVINENKEQFTSARSRFLLVELYSIAMKRSGLLGFGTEAVTGFPVRVPLGPQEVETMKRIRFVDNTYVLMTLRFGYCGVFFFTVALFAAAFQFVYVSTRMPSETPGILAGCLAGSLFGVIPVLFTVWMPPDYGFPLMWTCGASSGLLLALNTGNLKDRKAPK
ncbi:MAG: O-antigen ligase family protein [Pirellulaceae bacterium]|nr:O-antigen ligase family protein [Pirellulaceae bacterium]